MVASTRTKGHHALVQTKKEENHYVDIFSLQHRCTVFCVLHRKTSPVVLSAGQKIIQDGSSRLFWTPSRSSASSGLRLISLYLPQRKDDEASCGRH